MSKVIRLQNESKFQDSAPKKIIKRDGRIENFDRNEIADAIFKGALAVYPDRKDSELMSLSNVVTDKVVYEITKKQSHNEFVEGIPGVEEVQDIVEMTLMDFGEKKLAREYIRYRLKHEDIRAQKKVLIDSEKMVDDYLDKSDWQVKENSNMGFSLQGLNNYIISAATKSFWLQRVYDNTIADAHNSGDLHIHDLNLLSTYCCGWSLEDFLLKGFKGAYGKVESTPPRHFDTALGQLVNAIYTLQGEAAGAQAVSSFDTYLAPLVRHDNLDYKQVKQSIQKFVFNMNVPTRVGFHTPFFNITFDVKVSGTLKNQPVIIGGKPQAMSVYGDFQEEMDMINKAFCEVMMEGDARGRIFSFPIPTYNITKDFDWDSEVTDLIMEMTAKYGIPYFANFVNSDMSPDDVRSMCCRLRLDNRELRKRGGGLFGANPLTGSIGVVTINLPRLGYISNTEEELFERLRRLMDLAKSSLETKRKIIEQNTQMGLYPYSRFYLEAIYERFNQYWMSHFSTIGISGMNECIQNFFGKEVDLSTKLGKNFAVKILDYMRDVLVEYQEETGNMYNLEATPAESTGYRFAKLDKEKYSKILTAGNDEKYYTNSTQLPVGYTDDIFEALDLQEELQCKYTGGTVFHGFTGQKIDDLDTMKGLIRKVMENYEIPYFTHSPSFSICEDHGYIPGEEFSCPTCGKDTEVWSRIVGYYRPIANWNKGKQEEFKDRLTFKVQGE